MSDRAHAIISPSFLHVSLNCPGSVGLKESLPPEPPGLAAEKGTKIHDAGEKLLNYYLDYKVTGFKDDVWKQDLDDEILKVAEAWRDTVWEKAFEKSITGKVYGIEDKLYLSKKYSIYGTTDFWLVSTDERAKIYGMVLDLKSGFVYVEAEKNPQLAAYACALRNEVREKSGGKKDLDYVRAGIYQPFGEGDKYRESKFTSKQLDAWEKRFNQLAEKVYSKKPPFKAGDHCKYCPGKIACKTYDKYRTKETGLKLLDPEEFQFPEAPTIDPEVLIRIVKHEKHLKSFVAACKKELLAKLLRQEEVPGMKLVRSKTRRKWDETRLSDLEIELQNHHVALYESTPRGLTEIKTELGAKIPKNKVEETLKPFLITPLGGITLAGIEDPREAVTPTQGLFINDEEEEKE